ncbi:MAG: very short patch repair endonuclease [bacterium]|nr:very short patch repair endonuclease [bacterium]
MSRIKSRDTGLETFFLKLLSSKLYPKGYRYRKHYNRLPGKPDIIFSKQKIAVFIDGDFWHGYNLEKFGKKVPRKYWLPKIKRNIQRDKEVNSTLRKLKWRVLRFWEHEIRKNPAKALSKIEQTLKHRKRNAALKRSYKRI